jgi:hypothetical protein
VDGGVGDGEAGVDEQPPMSAIANRKSAEMAVLRMTNMKILRS